VPNFSREEFVFCKITTFSMFLCTILVGERGVKRCNIFEGSRYFFFNSIENSKIDAKKLSYKISEKARNFVRVGARPKRFCLPVQKLHIMAIQRIKSVRHPRDFFEMGVCLANYG
jgi:hypothetical protein